MNEKIKHLEMVEHIIERMAANSFHLKGWSMTLVAIVGTLSAKEADQRFVILAFAPIVVFWLLDSYYLQLERKYRALYREIAEKEIINFNLDTKKVHFTEDEKDSICFLRCLFSFSELLFYGTLTGTLWFLINKLNIILIF